MLAIALEWWGSAGAPVWLIEDLALISSKLQQGITMLSSSPNGQSRLFWTEAFTTVIRRALLSAGNVILTFLLRLAILLQALPLFALIIVVGLIDGLVRRDLRRFGAGHESGFVYHHAKRMIGSSLAATGLVWLTVPIFLEPEHVLVIGALIVSLTVWFTAGTFKKYL